MEDVKVSWEEAEAEVVVASHSTPMVVSTQAMEEPTMALQGLILGIATLMPGLMALLGLMGLGVMGQTLSQVRGVFHNRLYAGRPSPGKIMRGRGGRGRPY